MITLVVCDHIVAVVDCSKGLTYDLSPYSGWGGCIRLHEP